MDVGQAVIFAAVIVALVIAYCGVSIIRADNNQLRRYKIHDVRNELALVRGSLDLFIDMQDTPPKRLLDLQDSVATLCVLLRQDEEKRTRIRLRRFLKAMVQRVIYAHGEIIECDDPADPRVQVLPVELRRLLLNVLLNATQARESSGSNDLVLVTLSDTSIVVTNPASKRDCRMVQRRSGSTKGAGRGSGRGSIARCARHLGWSVQYAVEERTVITTLRWAVGRCYPTEDDGVIDEQLRPEDRPN